MPNTTSLQPAYSPPQYYTKGVCAKRLGLSVRRALEVMAQAQVARSHDTNPKTGRRQVALLAADVDRLVAQRKGQPVSIPLGIEGAAPSPPASAPSQLQWMNLEQAEQYIGLSRQLLLGRIRSGKLKALREPIRRDRYRVKKSDLDQIEGDNLTG